MSAEIEELQKEVARLKELIGVYGRADRVRVEKYRNVLHELSMARLIIKELRRELKCHTKNIKHL